LTLPSSLFQAALIACCTAHSLHVCLRPENSPFRLSDAVFRIIFGIPHEWPHKGSPLTLHAALAASAQLRG
jgi:hypothetical protein